MIDATTQCRTIPKFVDRLALGAGGLAVSPFCLGAISSPETVCVAFDAGINFFLLTADMHWPLYEASRQGLRQLLRRRNGTREQIVVAAVCYPTQPEMCFDPFREVLEAVPGLRTLDVLIAGAAYGDEFPARLRVYEQHRRDGFLGCRAIGATFHDRQAARRAIEEIAVDIALVRYNPGHMGARHDLFAHTAQPRSTVLFGFKSTFGYVSPEKMAELGLPGEIYWHPEITDQYRFALSRPELDGLLVSLSTPEEVAALAGALEKGPLDEEEETYLMNVALVAQGKARAGSETQEESAGNLGEDGHE